MSICLYQRHLNTTYLILNTGYLPKFSPSPQQDPFPISVLMTLTVLSNCTSHTFMTSLYTSLSLPLSNSSLCLSNYILNISSLLTLLFCLDYSDNLLIPPLLPCIPFFISLWEWCFQNTNLMVSPFGLKHFNGFPLLLG